MCPKKPSSSIKHQMLVVVRTKRQVFGPSHLRCPIVSSHLFPPLFRVLSAVQEALHPQTSQKNVELLANAVPPQNSMPPQNSDNGLSRQYRKKEKKKWTNRNKQHIFSTGSKTHRCTKGFTGRLRASFSDFRFFFFQSLMAGQLCQLRSADPRGQLPIFDVSPRRPSAQATVGDNRRRGGGGGGGGGAPGLSARQGRCT